jgi:hypothetical protein
MGHPFWRRHTKPWLGFSQLDLAGHGPKMQQFLAIAAPRLDLKIH